MGLVEEEYQIPFIFSSPHLTRRPQAFPLPSSGEKRRRLLMAVACLLEKGAIVKVLTPYYRLTTANTTSKCIGGEYFLRLASSKSFIFLKFHSSLATSPITCEVYFGLFLFISYVFLKPLIPKHHY